MGRLFSLVSMMAFVFMMVAAPLIAVFGLPQINPPFKELGDKLKESAMNKIRGTIVSDQDHINDPASPLYGLDNQYGTKLNNQELSEAAAWGDPRTISNVDQPAGYPGVNATVQPASFPQQPSNAFGVNQAVYQQGQRNSGIEAGGNQSCVKPQQELPAKHPPLMQTLLSEQQHVPQNDNNNILPAAFSRTVPSRQPGVLNQPQEPRSTMTFMQATRLLQELGIKEYSLEPGVQPDQFYFVCLYTPVDNPSVTTRFEAEANDPMIAVEKVLQQIHQTLQPKSSSLNQTNFNQPMNLIR